MTAKLCATERVHIQLRSTSVTDIRYTEVPLNDKFIGCDYIEIVTCRNTYGNQAGTIVFANSYCYAGCTSTMLLSRIDSLYNIAIKLSVDGSTFMYNTNNSSGFDEYIMILGYKFH